MNKQIKSFYISIVTATLNSGTVLEAELKSIRDQDYPQNKIEIIIADGGSADDTVKIANKYGAKVYKNKLKTGESGKAVGIKKAKGELIALIDSDNILPDKNWMKRMAEPFADKDIIASEPIKYTYRKIDPWLTRYFALLGMNDPICLFVGNYDRMSVLTGKWTNLNFVEEDKGNYLKICLDREPIPTIGANGFVIRRKVLEKAGIEGYLFDIDVLIKLMRERGQVYVAKVKMGIIHTFVEDSPSKFFRKQLRRINDMSYHRAQDSRDIDWEKLFFWRVVWFQLQCLLVVPVFYQMIKGYIRKRDISWIFHPVAIYSTWFIYLYGWIKGKISPKESDRGNWYQ